MALKTNFAINIVCEQYHSGILGGESDSLHVENNLKKQGKEETSQKR